MVSEYSPHQNVTEQTPPAFLFHTADDPVVPYQNSVLYFEALRAQNIPAALHVFPRGEHGVGLAQNNPELKAWPMLLENWLTHLF
jgi:dipeptidyl aminopeptidase/acylaminoacyl peptidase